MNWDKIIFFLCLFAVSQVGAAQPAEKLLSVEGDTVFVNNLLEQSKENFTDDPEKAIRLSMQAKELAEKLNFQKGVAIALKNLGLVHKKQGKYLEGLDYYLQSLKVYKAIKDNAGIANLYSNIGVAYYDRGDDAKALENYLESLKYSEQAGDKFRIFIALNNIGGIYYDKKATYDKALQYYLKALPLCEELDKKEELGAIAVNIGSIYFAKNEDAKALDYFTISLKAYGNSEGSLNVYNAMGKLYTREDKYELALKNHNKALAIAQKENDKTAIAQSFMGLGDVFKAKGDYKNALTYYKKAEIPAVEIKSLHELKDLYKDMAKAYAKTDDHTNAFKYESLYSAVKDTLYNIETDKKLGGLQFDFDLQKKQGEINLLTKDKALSDLELRRQKFAKNASLVGLGLIFLIAILIYRNYRAKVKTHKILDQQKSEIEGLLLTILPAEVAGELQTKGHADPKYYESVTVLFTDFKGFTMIADKMAPQDLVEELNTCFKAFDEIIGKHKIEKIKTIGDSYMCASGIPTPDVNHVENMVNAGLEIRDFVLAYNKKRNEAGLVPWELRIGIHTGPVVAGVVGKKKYAYDIWGSTVNIASRMESSSIPGKVNISSSVYDHIKDKYTCTYRGKIHAKNVGDIDMYFLEGPVANPEEAAIIDMFENKTPVVPLLDRDSK